MFWGLIMEPAKRYSQTVKKSFHISMAALDLSSCTNDPVQVMCGYENRKYLLCTLQKDIQVQCSLDLNYDVGDKVSFVTNGKSHVHLTGYLNDDHVLDLGSDEDEDEEEVADKLGNISESNIVSGKRPKKPASNDFEAPPAKKTKTMKMLEEANNESDSDDSDLNLSDIIEDDDTEGDTTFLDSDADEDDLEEEEDDDDDLEEEEEDEDSEEEGMEAVEESSDESSLSEEEVEIKPKVNGVKKEKKEGKNKNRKEVKESPVKTSAKEEKKTPKADKKQKEQQSPAKTPGGGLQKRTIEGGVIVEDIRAGNGQIAKPGRMVQVYYEGRFKSNNKIFDSANKGNGFKFRLGRQEVIKGWDVGVSGMKVGGKRRIVCPPNMAYGAQGSPPAIPPNSTLVFEVELKNVQ